MQVLGKWTTVHRFLITYLPSNDDMSLEEAKNVGWAWFTLERKNHLWMTGDCLSPVKMTLSPED